MRGGRSVEEDINGGHGDIGLVLLLFFFQVSLEGLISTFFLYPLFLSVPL